MSYDKMLSCLKNENWDELLPFIDTLIDQINNDALSDNFIAQLFKATIFSQNPNSNSLIGEEIPNMMRLSMEKIAIHKDDKKSMLAFALEMKRAVQMADYVCKMAEKEGLDPIMANQVEQIDTIEGTPIYKLKE